MERYITMTDFQTITTDKLGVYNPEKGFGVNRQWLASLTLKFGAHAEEKTSVTRLNTLRHFGPLIVQRAFYPEGRDGCCHVYIIHPPGGLVSGDELEFNISVDNNAHALVTTPAANKLYKADRNSVPWKQHTNLDVEDNAILEWLPQEAIAFDGSIGEQICNINLGENSKCLGWEITVLGRHASELPFDSGRITQQFNLYQNGRPLWLERQIVDPLHPRFKGKWGQGGATVHGNMWTVGLSDPLQAVVLLREKLPESNSWAVSERRGVLVIRYLGDDRNQVWELFQRAREVLRPLLIGIKPVIPRIWLT